MKFARGLAFALPLSLAMWVGIIWIGLSCVGCVSPGAAKIDVPPGAVKATLIDKEAAELLAQVVASLLHPPAASQPVPKRALRYNPKTGRDEPVTAERAFDRQTEADAIRRSQLQALYDQERTRLWSEIGAGVPIALGIFGAWLKARKAHAAVIAISRDGSA